ncbi:hypothetical protein ACM0CQ_05885 [Mycobacteroides abscessus subsp. abscessus]|uniref:hypothetical protein n=1 Tax=Mycobacteroides abscessus TaxID=36809 RepID=UPI000928A0AD|nr:hypothetical protein [Mycobacteroides abscessus]SIL36237.1 Putative cytochrome P450 [Mycobacteroides abscessus subsp. abscessus]
MTINLMFSGVADHMLYLPRRASRSCYEPVGSTPSNLNAIKHCQVDYTGASSCPVLT